MKARLVKAEQICLIIFMSKCIKMISPSQKRLVASLLVGAFIFLARPINALAETTFVYTFNDAINLTLNGSFGVRYSTFIPVTPNILNADAFVSLSGGGLTGAEGEATLFARFLEQPDVQLGSKWYPFQSAVFASIAPLTFSAPATFTGLVVAWMPQGGNRQLSIPVGTTLTMSVPEPTTAAFLAAGAVVIVSLSRRRRD
jgi:hypothetical protein